jgi:hypothetical protein
MMTPEERRVFTLEVSAQVLAIFVVAGILIMLGLITRAARR